MLIRLSMTREIPTMITVPFCVDDDPDCIFDGVVN